MLGKIIRFERKKRGLTQHQLAAATGIPRSSIDNWETGVSSINAKNLMILADFFNCTTDYLLGRADK